MNHPEPSPDLDDAEWWAATSEGRLTVAWCDECDRSWLRPTPTCPRCGAAAWTLRDVEPSGTVYSWVTVHKALDPSFAGEEPYTVAAVELQGGARLNVRILGGGRAPEAGEVVAVEVFDDEHGHRLPGARFQGATPRVTS